MYDTVCSVRWVSYFFWRNVLPLISGHKDVTELKTDYYCNSYINYNVTVVTCVLFLKQANVGDSRAIASVNGNVDVLSLDHKPVNDTEIKRIQAAGGWVEFNRVNGNLALSRALGDFVFKRNEKKTAEEQIVTGELRYL